jgi:hypothetical protein
MDYFLIIKRLRGFQSTIDHFMRQCLSRQIIRNDNLSLCLASSLQISDMLLDDIYKNDHLML